MTARFPDDLAAGFQARLASHPIYSALRDLGDLQTFMRHHVFSVWDFMSLCKFLQREAAPIAVPWQPRGDPSVRRLINAIVLEEESDEAPADADGTPRFASHFELYCAAMAEIGADTGEVRRFVERAARSGIRDALDTASAPPAARSFVATTFSFIETGKPHVVAAAFAMGREHIIPAMFRSFLRDMGISDAAAPVFHFYLNRHIHLDEDFHAPMSMRLLDQFCAGQPDRLDEAVAAAEQAVAARIAFWDGVMAELA